MMAAWDRLSLLVGDTLTGWASGCSQDVCLIVLVVLTVAGVFVSRLLMIGRRRRRHFHEDARRQRVLRQQSGSDHNDPTRLRRIRRLVARKRLRHELPCLAIQIVWIALLMNWGTHRLEFERIGRATPITTVIQLPADAEDEFIVMNPAVVFVEVGSWVRKTGCRIDGRPSARWTVYVNPKLLKPSLQITWSTSRGTVSHPVRTSANPTAPQHVDHDNDVSTSIFLPSYRPFQKVPDIGQWDVSAWVVGYSLGMLIVLFAIRELRAFVRMFADRSGGDAGS